MYTVMVAVAWGPRSVPGTPLLCSGAAWAPRDAAYPAGCSQGEISLKNELQTVSRGYFLYSIREASYQAL